MYITSEGDTFATVSRREYGTEEHAEIIRRANPGIEEPLGAGVSLVVPALSGAPVDNSVVTGQVSDDEISLLINKKRFRLWQSMNIARTIDAPDTISITAPFEPDDAAMREAFRPLSFNPMSVSVGRELIFNGTMIDPVPSTDQTDRMISVSGYALPGVLNDCTVSASDYPVQFDNADLRTIVNQLIEPFGLSVVFDGDAGAPFERVAIQPAERILSFIIKLAQERGLLVASTARGDLRFWKGVTTGLPVARLEEGEPPLLSVAPTFDSQSFYSHVTGVQWVITGLLGNQYTQKNTLVSGAFRPITFNVTDTQGGDLQSTVEAKTGRMVANAVTYSVPVSTWRDSRGKLWEPNTLITLRAPGAMVYNEYTFLIKSVSLSATPTERTALLELVLPGAYTDNLPESMPWD